MRTALAWHNMTCHRLRAAASVAGVAFAVMLVYMQLGFYDACFRSSTLVYDQLSFDVALVSPQYVHLRAAGVFPLERLSQAESLAGVANAAPLYVASGLYRTSDARVRREIIVLGVDPADHPFRIPAMADQAHRLAGRDTAIMDSSTVKGYGPVVPGLRTEVEHRSIEIIATYAHGTGFIAPASMFVSGATLARLFPRSAVRLVGLGLLRLTPGASPEAVARRLQAVLPGDVRAMTRTELEQSEQRYFVQGRPLGIMFSGGVLLAFTVGAVILYQILAAEVLRQYKEYATLKAIGYGTGYLNAVVLKQAAMFAIFGFLPGTGAAWGLYAITRMRTNLPMFMTPGRIATVLVLSLAMCAVAGLLASRKAAKADPADLF